MRLKYPAALPSGTKQYMLLPPSHNAFETKQSFKKLSLSVSTSLLSTSSLVHVRTFLEFASESSTSLGGVSGVVMM